MKKFIFSLLAFICFLPSVHAQTIQVSWGTALQLPDRLNMGMPCQTQLFFNISDTGIDDALFWATNIHQAVTNPNYKLDIYEKLIFSSINCNADYLKAVQISKRFFIVQQWSKFIKSNMYRVHLTNPTNLLVTAFQNQDKSKFIVAVNKSSSDENKQIFDVGSDLNCINCVTPIKTDTQTSLANQQSVSIVNGKFTYTIPETSVVTFSISTPYRGGQ